MQSGNNGTPRNRRAARYDQPMPDSVPSSNRAARQAVPQNSYYQSRGDYAQTSWPAPPAGYARQGYTQQQTAPQNPPQYCYQPQNPPPQQWQQPNYGGGNGGNSGDSGKKPPKKNKRGSFIASLLRWIVIVFIMGGLIAVGLHYAQDSMQRQQAEAYVSSFDDKFIHGVYVDGIHLGGMTLQEGTDAVVQQAQQRNDSWYVRLTFAGQTVLELRASHLGMTTNVTEAIQQAWAQGHTGDMQQRLVEMEKKLTQPFEAYTALPSGDTSVIDGLLSELANKVYRAPVDAQLVGFHPELTDPETIFEITDEVQGRSLDTAALKEKLYQMVSTMTSGDIEIVPATVEPALTKEQVRQTVSLRADIYTKISTTSTEERTNNIRRAFELMNGTVLLPGQEFSFNKIVGQRSAKNGFFPAIEYAYGEQVLGYGGGVCQASSTIYIAAVQANLQITDREPHSMQVNYTDYGKDATVNLDGKKIDFKFKNNTDAPIYIVCSVQSNPQNRKRLIARTQIFGLAHEENTMYDLVCETTEILPIPFEPVHKKDKNAQYVKYTDQEKTVEGKEGCVVKSWRVKYVNGEEVERTELYTDTYKAQPNVVYTGVTTRE